MEHRLGGGAVQRSAATGRFVTTVGSGKVAASTVVRNARTARVASALSKANTATGLLGQGGTTRDPAKK